MGILGFILVCGCVCSCGNTRFIPVESEKTEKIEYKDSTIWNIKDSVVYIPVERYKDYTGFLDTLTIEGTLSIAKAWNDTTRHILTGTLENKEGFSKETKTEYRYKIVEKTDTVFVKEPVPYPVTKIERKIPKWVWVSLVFNLLVLLWIGLRIYLRLK